MFKKVILLFLLNIFLFSSWQFMEQKKALKEEGRNDKDLVEHYAFYCVDTENEVSYRCINMTTGWRNTTIQYQSYVIIRCYQVYPNRLCFPVLNHDRTDHNTNHKYWCMASIAWSKVVYYTITLILNCKMKCTGVFVCLSVCLHLVCELPVEKPCDWLLYLHV